MTFKIIFFLLLIPLIFFLSYFGEANAFIKFDEVSNSSGIEHTGASWGGYWGDFNSDGWPDLWMSAHGATPKLYLNNQNSTFTDITNSLDLDMMKNKDVHGSSWADFDNDGDEDLIVLTGAKRGLGEGKNFFLVNENGSFINKAKEFQLDYSLGRGRTPLWFDFNNDGLLDIFISNALRPDGKDPPALFRQDSHGFSVANDITGLDFKKHVGLAQISDLSRDGKMDLVVLTLYSHGVFRITDLPFLNVKDQIGLKNFWAGDVAISDFNGDLEPDFILVDVDRHDSNTALFNKKIKSILSTNNDKYEFSFKTTGNATFKVFPFALKSVPQDDRLICGQLCGDF